MVLLKLPVTVGCGDDEKTSEPTSEPTVTETVATEPATAEPVTMETPANQVMAEPRGILTVALSQVDSEPDLSPFTRAASTTNNVSSHMADYLIFEKYGESGYIRGLLEERNIAPDRIMVLGCMSFQMNGET